MKEFLIIKLYTLIIWLCKAYEATMLHANHISPRLMELCVNVDSLCAGLLSFFDGCVSVCFLLYSRHDGIVHRKTAFPRCACACACTTHYFQCCCNRNSRRRRAAGWGGFLNVFASFPALSPHNHKPYTCTAVPALPCMTLHVGLQPTKLHAAVPNTCKSFQTWWSLFFVSLHS